ncbi:MAG: MoaD/ThiS family protein [Anaerolineae bacterium]|nr:MoaD/ThiS family protein [Anaerolineae bacterium]
MATVWIPPLLQDMTDGKTRLAVPGATVREMVAELDRRYPGIGARLVDDGRIRPGISLVVDGIVSRAGLRHRLTETSEVHFVPAISGG